MNTHDQWMPCGDAHILLLKSSTVQKPSEVLLRRLGAGLIRARARSIQMDGREEFEGLVPAEFWAGGDEAFEISDWATGDFVRRPNLGWHVIYAAEFDRQQIEAMCDLGLPASDEKSTRGRPKFDWWEDLWVEIAASLYVGDLKPRCQADLQNAILDWATRQGHELGATAAKDRARKLWAAIQAKDGN